ncbi:hypothetical protein [Tatumella morbirosei]|uniref:hypothetical protein n=1 Tax=Tatumella morbirosei TaxID=642227 RepID=UPI00069C177D|nr:hypothetical protein [Tatumella morbirosei]
MTFRLTQIDELTRPDHYYLDETDHCYFFGEYTARQGFSYSSTNQLILNLKKGNNEKGTFAYRYKGVAIQQVANLITSTITNLHDYTFVPIPPSKCSQDPAYDDRITAILRLCHQTNGNVQFREMISQRHSMGASHNSAARPSPAQIEENYEFNQEQANGIRGTIVIFDDVLTAGSHYKAMKDKIKNISQM